MGIVISTGTPTSPFFLTSGIIGFVSFAFTLGTFVRVIWTNLETLCEAHHEVHSYLTNLRTELLEERANLKMMRKGMELDDVSLKTMSDVVRQLCKKMKELERPFLAEGEAGIGDANGHRKRARRRNSSLSPPHYDHAAYSSPPEKGSRRRSTNHDDEYNGEGDEVDDDSFWAQRTRYADFTLGKRWTWLRKKADAQQILEAMTRLQTRRIARQVGGMAMLMHEYGCETLELNETVRRIDERVSRVVGVRRME
ncbi:uncharacterized protein LTR77_004028 [Saxophila tyrrhenica]|uniref:Uncharacterized protein n=1 Tax=Saxophila tyrrhenica TaxID=1690608 RepID=A0AAV9PBG3_9PEZI|nr:hypothetical protein LTR77_004028 [Saxophila tyrrhenica]